MFRGSGPHSVMGPGSYYENRLASGKSASETTSSSTKQEAAAAEKNASSEITCPYPTHFQISPPDTNQKPDSRQVPRVANLIQYRYTSQTNFAK